MCTGGKAGTGFRCRLRQRRCPGADAEGTPKRSCCSLGAAGGGEEKRPRQLGMGGSCVEGNPSADASTSVAHPLGLTQAWWAGAAAVVAAAMCGGGGKGGGDGGAGGGGGDGVGAGGGGATGRATGRWGRRGRARDNGQGPVAWGCAADGPAPPGLGLYVTGRGVLSGGAPRRCSPAEARAERHRATGGGPGTDTRKTQT